MRSRHNEDDCVCPEDNGPEACSCGSRNVVGRLNGSDCCEACWPTELAYYNRRKAEAAARKAKQEMEARAAVEASLMAKARAAE